VVPGCFIHRPAARPQSPVSRSAGRPGRCLLITSGRPTAQPQPPSRPARHGGNGLRTGGEFPINAGLLQRWRNPSILLRGFRGPSARIQPHRPPAPMSAAVVSADLQDDKLAPLGANFSSPAFGLPAVKRLSNSATSRTMSASVRLRRARCGLPRRRPIPRLLASDSRAQPPAPIGHHPPRPPSPFWPISGQRSAGKRKTPAR